MNQPLHEMGVAELGRVHQQLLRHAAAQHAGAADAATFDDGDPGPMRRRPARGRHAARAGAVSAALAPAQVGMSKRTPSGNCQP